LLTKLFRLPLLRLRHKVGTNLVHLPDGILMTERLTGRFGHIPRVRSQSGHGSNRLHGLKGHVGALGFRFLTGPSLQAHGDPRHVLFLHPGRQRIVDRVRDGFKRFRIMAELGGQLMAEGLAGAHLLHGRHRLVIRHLFGHPFHGLAHHGLHGQTLLEVLHHDSLRPDDVFLPKTVHQHPGEHFFGLVSRGAQLPHRLGSLLNALHRLRIECLLRLRPSGERHDENQPEC
jgi:hypothetical protein